MPTTTIDQERIIEFRRVPEDGGGAGVKIWQHTAACGHEIAISNGYRNQWATLGPPSCGVCEPREHIETYDKATGQPFIFFTAEECPCCQTKVTA